MSSPAIILFGKPLSLRPLLNNILALAALLSGLTKTPLARFA